LVLTLAELPNDVRALAEAFASELTEVLGGSFAGFFLYGSACFPPSAVIDFDGHVLLSHPMSDDDRQAVEAMHARLRPMPLGDEMDVWYVTTADAAKPEIPVHQRNTQLSDGAWALHRAHVHAGRYVCVAGVDPRDLVPEPTWSELDNALQNELAWLSKHFDDAPAYCVLNLCRILCSYESRDAVVSKLQAGSWAIAALDVDHHPRIRAAIAAYESGTSGADDDALAGVRGFFEEMSARVEKARTS
jgi:hypothetical protein